MTDENIIVRNPAARDQERRARFPVDTGAIDSLVPGPSLESIRPDAAGRPRLHAGFRHDVTVAEFEILGQTVGGTVVFCPPRAEPLLGTTVLESAGVYIDPFNRGVEAASPGSALSRSG